MPIPQARENFLFVQLPQKYYTSYKFESGVELHFDPKWAPEEYAMLEGRVVSKPMRLQDREDYHGYSTDGINVGDTVIMRYDVVQSYKDQPDQDTPRYKNEMWLDQQSFWRCNILSVLGVRQEDGSVRMVNGHVMLEPVMEDGLPKSTLIIIPDSIMRVKSTTTAKVMHVAPESEVQPGQLVTFPSNLVQKYEINNKPFWVIKSKYIMGAAAL